MNPNRPRIAASLLAILAICTAIELVLTAGDLGVTADLRSRVVALGGFRPALLGSAQELFPGQRATMFLSYSLLHAGLGHLAVNMLTLVALGSAVVARAGQGVLLLICLAATVAGAAGYALIGPSDLPMVGASGALFGLAGALIGWEIGDARREGASLAPALRFVLLLVVLNAVLWWVAGGRLAWQAHLGGGCAGLAFALTRPAPRIERV